jgi:hypothetical protein
MSEPSTASFTGAAIVAILAATVLTVPASWGLLRLYRRAVYAAMRRRISYALPEQTATDTRPTPSAPTQPLALETREPATQLDLTGNALSVRQRANTGPWKAAAVYTAAGLAYAVTTAVVWLLSASTPMLPIRTLGVIWSYAWPLVLALNVLLTTTWRVKIASVVAFMVGLQVLFTLGHASLGDAVVFWTTLAGFPTLVSLVAFLHPKFRTISPVVFAFLLLAFAGAQIAVTLVDNDVGVAGLVALSAVLYVAPETLLLAVALVGFVGFGLLGWIGLNGLVRAYSAKLLSDQALVLDSHWLIFALLTAFELARSWLEWAAITLAIFAVYKVVAIAGFSMVRRLDTEPSNHRLLLLRVFGSSERSERLMAVVGARWRHAGSIQLIAGADLAASTVEPHEFLAFASGNLAGSFIHDRQRLEQHLAAMDLRPDPDGRFRVNEFFCYDDTWKMSLSRLVGVSDAVLMDLRGFSRANQGAAFELRELINLTPLSRVVLVVDDTTDLALVRELIHQAWAALPDSSPNRGVQPARLLACRISRVDASAARFLVAAIASAASTVDAPSRSRPAVA